MSGCWNNKKAVFIIMQSPGVVGEPLENVTVFHEYAFPYTPEEILPGAGDDHPGQHARDKRKSGTLPDAESPNKQRLRNSISVITAIEGMVKE
jgi:hypothetical protein